MRQEMMGFWDAASDGPYANSMTSLQADNQANILQLNFYRLDAPLPDAQPTVPKHSLEGMSLYLFYFILFILLIYFFVYLLTIMIVVVLLGPNLQNVLRFIIRLS